MMIKKSKFKFRLRITILLMILLMTSIQLNYPANKNNIIPNKDNSNEDNDISEVSNILNEPKSSLLGNASWWDYSFNYRRLITVENSYYPINFTNYGVSVSFNYAQLGSKIQSDLDDIRIVENGIPRKFYVVKDYPSVGFATVYFDTNISSISDKDTYLYFGNPSAVNNEASGSSESFGWVKNGDFELDIQYKTKYNPYGWTFSHEPINTLITTDDIPYPNAGNWSDLSYEKFLSKVTNSTAGARDIANGENAYIWGSDLELLSETANVYDYAGTFYSYPFTIPTVEGGDVWLQIYRNARTFHFEERSKPNDDFDKTPDPDGYFMRLCNASSYGANVDSHTVAGSDDYIEAYGGNAVYSPSGKFWTDETELRDIYDKSDIYDTKSKYEDPGDVTGIIYYNVTDLMGKEVFIELGAWGEELGDLGQNQGQKSAFIQVDYVQFNYTLTASIDELQAYESTVTIITKDFDGRIVPTADVFIINDSARGTEDFYIDYGSTIDGSITFTGIANGWYDITSNFTLNSWEEEVYNSTESGDGPYYFNGISYTVEIYLDIWTIDFEIVDWDGIPLSQGYIEVNESYGGNLLDTLLLDDNGKATFRWINKASYYYTVYYDNNDYSSDFSPKVLNQSIIMRTGYESVKEQNHLIKVNQTNSAQPGNRYLINKKIYTNGSETEFGNKKIITVNLTLVDMEDYLKNVSIYYIDGDDSTGTDNENLIYFEDNYDIDDDDDFIQIDIMTVDNDKLKSENYEAFGLLILVNGINISGQCNGRIYVDLFETCNIYNRTALAMLNLQVIHITPLDPDGSPLSASVKVLQNSTENSIVTLKSEKDATPPLEDGYAYGQINKIPLWYLVGTIFNFSIDVANLTSQNFNVTNIYSTYQKARDQWRPTENTPGISWYNYTHYGNATIIFNIIVLQDINFTDFDTVFYSAFGVSEVLWMENMTFSVNFTYTDDGGDTWIPVINPSAYCTLTIKLAGSDVVLISERMIGLGNGNFSKTINSSRLSAGNSYQNYNIEINGFHPTYDNPNNQLFTVKVNALPTALNAYNYDPFGLNAGNYFSQTYSELINITIRYYRSDTDTSLQGAVLKYQWVGLSPITMQADPIHSGYYYFTINTSEALSTGIKIIIITALLENYTSQPTPSQPFQISLNVLERSASINGKIGLLYLSRKVWVQDSEIFNFTYRDSDDNIILGDLDLAFYTWQELNEDGSPISGKDGTGTLMQNADNIYTLDFRTGTKAVGYYSLYVNLKKENYELRAALINLEIQLREFDADLDATNLDDDQATVVQGKDVKFEIELRDTTRGNIRLTGAKVVLEIGDDEYEFDEDEPGIYTYTFSTEEIDAFYTSQTFTGQIVIKKANFTSDEIDITIVVTMEEVYPGMPTFYFIMLIAIIGGTVGGLVSYRTIQQARIPKHVKKIRLVKKKIKARDSIPSISIPTKEQMIMKQFSGAWRDLDLSFEDTLGIKDKKSKILSEGKKTLKQQGGED